MNEILRIYSGRNRPALAPVYRMFEQLTGVRVEAQRISHHEACERVVAERADPQADVFITNTQVKLELVRPTGVFEPYAADVAQRYEPWLRAPDYSWLSFAAWPRTAMINLATMGGDAGRWPTRVEDLTDRAYAGRVLIASTQETMTGAYFAALRVAQGDAWTIGLVDRLLDNGMRVYKSNLDVRNALVREGYGVALANGSNNHVFRMEGNAVAEGWLDQAAGGIGTNVEAHTVAVLSGARNARAARAFVDFLLSKDVQELLARMYGETPVNPDAATGWVRPLSSIRRVRADLGAIAERLASTTAMLRERGFDMSDVDDGAVSTGRHGRRKDVLQSA